MSSEGRSTAQLRFNEQPSWLCGKLPTRGVTGAVPFVALNGVQGETPAFCLQHEVRRRDVGVQRYGSGEPKFECGLVDYTGLINKYKPKYESFVTAHGNISVPSHHEKCGFLPSADVVNFLRSEYRGSRQPDTKTRYYPI